MKITEDWVDRDHDHDPRKKSELELNRHLRRWLQTEVTVHTVEDRWVLAQVRIVDSMDELAPDREIGLITVIYRVKNH